MRLESLSDAFRLDAQGRSIASSRERARRTPDFPTSPSSADDETGGILLTQVRRSTAPLEAALDAILDHVASFLTPRGRRSDRVRASR